MIRKLSYALIGALLVAALALGLVFWKLHTALGQPLQIGEAQTLEVQPGDTPSGLFQRLIKQETKAQRRRQLQFHLRNYLR